MSSESTLRAPEDVVRAAEARYAAFASRLARLGVEDVRRLVRRPDDPAERAVRLAELDALAARAGLTEQLAHARGEVRDYVLRAIGGSTYRPTWAALDWGLSSGTTADRVAIVEMAEDGAAAAILEGLVTDDLVAELRAPFEQVAGMVDPAGDPGALGSWLERTRRPGQPTPVVVLLAVVAVLTTSFLVGSTVAAAAVGAAIAALAGAWRRRAARR